LLPEAFEDGPLLGTDVIVEDDEALATTFFFPLSTCDLTGTVVLAGTTVAVVFAGTTAAVAGVGCSATRGASSPSSALILLASRYIGAPTRQWALT
jgi:hypothetical protein